MDPDTKALLRTRFAKGELFEGKFRIEGHLGTGSFAYVMLATHEAMDRRVALKVLKPELVGANPALLKRFVNEVKIVAKLSHPNTVTVFDFGRTDDNIHYLVMEYVEGVTLDEVLKEQGAVSPHRAVAIIKQVLKSLSEAHAYGIVHRDLKPANIMITYSHDEKEIAKVLDFGVAKLVEANPSPSRGVERRSTQFVGTPVYMSPEQVLGEDVVPASDLYSLGLILYEMLTGDSPFAEASVALVAQAHIDPDPLPFAKLDQLTMRFQKLILRATAREVQDRFVDVGSFARALPSGGGSSDFSAEFAKLMTEEHVFEEASGLEDVSETTWEAFSGSNYIEAPESEAAEDSPPGERPREIKPAQPVRLNWDDEQPKRPSSGVALDVGSVRRDEMRRKRDVPTGPRPVVVERDWRPVAWIAGGLFAFNVAFIVASTAFVDGDGADRWLIGVAPVGLAVLWSQFAGVRRHHGGNLETIVVPLAKHMVWTALALILIVCVVMPEAGASRMENSGAWFVQDIAETSPLHVIYSFERGISSFLGLLFSFSSKVVPW